MVITKDPARYPMDSSSADPYSRHAVETDASLRQIGLGDRDLLSVALASLTEPTSDTTTAATICWSDALHMQLTEVEGHACVFSAADGDLSMMLPPLPLDPSQTDRLDDALGACFEIMDETNSAGLGVDRSRIDFVPGCMVDRILACEGLTLVSEAMPGDYVYDRHELVELAGGDLKNKRKLRSKFVRENTDIATGPITPADIPECVALLANWRRAADVKHEGEANELLYGVDILRERDECCTRCYLDLIDDLELRSMTVRVDGILVGFTIGERLTPTMGVVSVEKTAPGIAGTPQFIYSEFCRTMFADVDEINAGDDWGIATLRYTKESYRPTRMLSKWSISREARAEQKTPERSVIRTLTYRRRNSTVMEPAAPARAAVRRATLADAKAIIGIETRAFDQPKEAFTMPQIRRLISNPRARVGIVEVDGIVAGWCVSLIRSHLRSRSGRVYSVAVLPEHAGKGLGRALIEWSLGTLESESIHRIYLEVRASNIAALGLYQSVGFTPIRTLVDYYGQGTDGIRMRRTTPAGSAVK